VGFRGVTTLSRLFARPPSGCTSPGRSTKSTFGCTDRAFIDSGACFGVGFRDIFISFRGERKRCVREWERESERESGSEQGREERYREKVDFRLHCPGIH